MKCAMTAAGMVAAMSAVTPALLRFVAGLNAAPPVCQPHQITAMTARGFAGLLTPGERWFLDAVAQLSHLSEAQQRRLLEIASKIERTRK